MQKPATRAMSASAPKWKASRRFVSNFGRSGRSRPRRCQTPAEGGRRGGPALQGSASAMQKPATSAMRASAPKWKASRRFVSNLGRSGRNLPDMLRWMKVL